MSDLRPAIIKLHQQREKLARDRWASHSSDNKNSEGYIKRFEETKSKVEQARSGRVLIANNRINRRKINRELSDCGGHQEEHLRSRKHSNRKLTKLIDENSTSLVVINKLPENEQISKTTTFNPNQVTTTPTILIRKNSEDVELSEEVETPSQRETKRSSPASYIDDLSLEETEEDIAAASQGTNDSFVEDCLGNRDKLAEDNVQRLLRQRRRLGQLIKRVNKQQNMFCRPDQSQQHIPYRKCPVWRQEKLIHYYKMMRLTYCSNYNKWPNAPKVKRIFGHQFPLFEKLYASTQKL